jgi:hypothetical protein
MTAWMIKVSILYGDCRELPVSSVAHNTVVGYRRNRHLPTIAIFHTIWRLKYYSLVINIERLLVYLYGD